METRARALALAGYLARLDQPEPKNMTEKLFEAALGISGPWFVAGVDFDAPARQLTIRVDFRAGSRFGVPGSEGMHPVHDNITHTALNPEAKIVLTTRPTPVQHKAFSLLGLNPARTQ